MSTHRNRRDFQFTTALIAFGFAAMLQPALADDALYDEAPPPDAVFIRSFLPTAPSNAVDGIPPFAVTSIVENDARYSALSAAEFSLPDSGGYYALMADADGAPRLVQEPARDDRSKVHLILLNALGEDVRVVAPEHGAEVVAPTAPYSSSGRAVNPITVTLAVENVATGEQLEAFDLRLRRNQNLTFFVGPDGVELVENAFGPVVRKR